MTKKRKRRKPEQIVKLLQDVAAKRSLNSVAGEYGIHPHSATRETSSALCWSSASRI